MKWNRKCWSSNRYLLLLLHLDKMTLKINLHDNFLDNNKHYPFCQIFQIKWRSNISYQKLYKWNTRSFICNSKTVLQITFPYSYFTCKWNHCMFYTLNSQFNILLRNPICDVKNDVMRDKTPVLKIDLSLFDIIFHSIRVYLKLYIKLGTFCKM